MSYFFDSNDVSDDGIHYPVVANANFIEISKVVMQSFRRNAVEVLFEPNYFLNNTFSDNRIELLKLF